MCNMWFVYEEASGYNLYISILWAKLGFKMLVAAVANLHSVMNIGMSQK